MNLNMKIIWVMDQNDMGKKGKRTKSLPKIKLKGNISYFCHFLNILSTSDQESCHYYP